MRMPVRMRLAGRIIWPVTVSVRFVVDMRMRMRLGTMNMLVLVSFGDMQPHAQRHERACHDQLDRNGFVQNDDRDHGPEKRSRGKLGGRPGRPQMPQCEHVEHQAHAEAHEANDRRHRARKQVGQGTSRRKAQQQIDWTGNKTLERDDLQRIG
jgi:hypothetical protein